MSKFFEHTCHKCGATDEAMFVYAGPHIKQVCNACGFYVKFFDKAKIPDIKEIKLRMWSISNQNAELINSLKPGVNFIEGMTGLDGKIMYWKLYLALRSKLAL